MRRPGASRRHAHRIRRTGGVRCSPANPSVGELLLNRAGWAAIVGSQMKLLADVEPGVGGQVKAAIAMSGVSGAVGLE